MTAATPLPVRLASAPTPVLSLPTTSDALAAPAAAGVKISASWHDCAGSSTQGGAGQSPSAAGDCSVNEAVAAATGLAAAIVRPIGSLIQATRRYQSDGLPPAAVPRSRITELGELGNAYLEMIRNVERSRQAMVSASKLAMLGELAAVLAHEVRTPLGILRSSAQLLLRDDRLSADSRELMGFIESETQRLNRLVSALLDTARPRPPSFAPCDLNALLARCAQMQGLQAPDARDGARDGAGMAPPRIALTLDATQATVDADAEQLMQAVFNLLQNAIQAAGAEGWVQLSTADREEGVDLVCADDGPGIALEIADRIFDPFFTRREGGFGLGLSVVQQVVQAHGGTIAVGRSAWGGTAFTCHLPHHPPHHPPRHPLAATGSHPGDPAP